MTTEYDREFWGDTDEAAVPDQTAKHDEGKLQLSLVPTAAIRAMAMVRMDGCKKYREGGPNNWKQVGKERYADALYRHWLAYLDDPEGLDEESRLPHIWHVACNAAFIIQLEADECPTSMLRS